ncbi:MAG: helix-hairpin-helix domain-containing protein [Planctomycetia bacterium]|nr:helix-hairpin-helix domain-containing protein [Planctomycetia bacterium]
MIKKQGREQEKDFRATEMQKVYPAYVWYWENGKNCRFFPFTVAEQMVILGLLFLAFGFIFFTFFLPSCLPFSRNDELQIKSGAFSVSETYGTVREKDVYLVNINTASVPELCILPGIGEITARKIVAEREENGLFRSMEDIERVHGIGAKMVEKLKPYLVPISVPEAVAEQKMPSDDKILRTPSA